MATKKISELTAVTSVNDADLLIVETSSGTRAVNKSNLLADVVTNIKTEMKVKTASVTLVASSWGYDPTNDWYWEYITVPNVTVKSKVDLQPDAVALKQMMNDGVTALYTYNSNGTMLAYTLGGKLTANLTVQATITEVA